MDLARDKVVSQIVARLSQAKGPVKVEGTWGSFAHLLTAHISNTLHRPVLHICPHIDDADKAFDDLKTFGVERVELLPAWEGEEELADATDETRSERLRIVSLLADRGRCAGPGDRGPRPGPLPADSQAVGAAGKRPAAQSRRRRGPGARRSNGWSRTTSSGSTRSICPASSPAAAASSTSTLRWLRSFGRRRPANPQSQSAIRNRRPSASNSSATPSRASARSIWTRSDRRRRSRA